VLNTFRPAMLKLEQTVSRPVMAFRR
jgi:hypothetical protein